MNFEGHQFGPILNQAGMLPDINRANEALKAKIGDSAYQKLNDDAYYEIAKSASQLLMGGDRDALAGYLKLEAGDPVAAAEIFNKAVSPTSSGSSIKMSPDEYKGMNKSPEDIVSQDQADGYKAFAHDREVSMGTVPAYQGPGVHSVANVIAKMNRRYRPGPLHLGPRLMKMKLIMIQGAVKVGVAADLPPSHRSRKCTSIRGINQLLIMLAVLRKHQLRTRPAIRRMEHNHRLIITPENADGIGQQAHVKWLFIQQRRR